MKLLKNRCFRMVLAFCVPVRLLPVYSALSQSQKHPVLKWWTVGSGGMEERFGEGFNQVLDELEADKKNFDLFLYTIAEAPLSEEQIAAKSGMTKAQVAGMIEKLSSIHLIKKNNQNKWATTVPVITDWQMRLIKEKLFPMAEDAAEYLKKVKTQLVSLYNRSKDRLDHPWNELDHYFFDKFIMDGTFHRSINNLDRERVAKTGRSGRQTGTPLFFFELGPNNSILGSNWYAFRENGKQREINFIHGPLNKRFTYPVEKYRRSKEFCAAYFKIAPDGKLDALNAGEKDMFAQLGWTDNDRLLVPIVKSTTVKAIIPTLTRMGNEAAEIAYKHFNNITRSFKEGPYS